MTTTTTMTTADDLARAIEATITGLFPESFVRVACSTNITTTIRIVFAFTRREGWSNGIVENDRAFHRIFVGNGEIAGDGTLPARVGAELLTGGVVFGPNVTNRVRVGWRNRTGTPDQIVRHFATYFARLETAVREHPDAAQS